MGFPRESHSHAIPIPCTNVKWLIDSVSAPAGGRSVGRRVTAERWDLVEVDGRDEAVVGQQEAGSAQY